MTVEDAQPKGTFTYIPEGRSYALTQEVFDVELKRWYPHDATVEAVEMTFKLDRIEGACLWNLFNDGGSFDAGFYSDRVYVSARWKLQKMVHVGGDIWEVEAYSTSFDMRLSISSGKIWADCSMDRVKEIA